MNKLLIALLMLPALAQAEVIAITKNKGGGMIVLTNEACREAGYRLAYSQMDGMPTLLGCYGTDNQFIHIQWYDGELRSYPYNGWTIIKKDTKGTM